jgi:uncharacterized protein YciI
MKSSVIVVLLLLLFASFLQAQEDSTKPREKKYEMRTYYIVFLYKGPNRSQDSVTAAEIQKGHLANIERLAEEGKIAIAGPFLDNTDLRGIFIMSVDSMEEAKKLCETDPAIIAGRLRYEIHPWMSARGSRLP